METRTKSGCMFGRRTRAGGFTLVELITVLLIMTLLLSASVAAFTSMVQSKGVEGARRAISSALFTARMKAIRDKREVACMLSLAHAVDSGFVVNTYTSALMGVINRRKRQEETWQDIKNETAAHKDWQHNEFVPETDGTAYWAFVIGGQRSGSMAPITKVVTNGLLCEDWPLLRVNTDDWIGPRPENNDSLCIVTAAYGDDELHRVLPVIEQYKISSDMVADEWEILPKFVVVDGKYFPITFRPDGSAAFPYDHAVIKMRDLRKNSLYWHWRLIVDRGSGSCSASMIKPTDSDSEIEG